MNTDHADAVHNYLKAFGSLPSGCTDAEIDRVLMSDVNATCVELRLEKRTGAYEKIQIPYSSAGLPHTLESADQVRSALVVMAKAARKVLERQAPGTN